MKLYCYPPSPYVRKVLLAAALLGIELEIQPLDLFAGESKTPDFLRLNPQGKVPTLVDGDFALWESNAIVQYLAEQAPGSALVPADARGRADVLRWQFWESTTWAPACMAYVYERLLKPKLGRGEIDPDKLQRADEKFHPSAQLLDEHLAARAWLAGDALSLADLSVAPMLMYAEKAQYPLTGYPHLAAWFAKVQQLPAWQATEPAAAF